MTHEENDQGDQVMMEFHPVADLFPMLAEDELQELAEDIKQRGLLHPIVLDVQGRVLDGRNRFAACALAGVEPAFATYDGLDPDGYALASNGQVREMTKSQKALVGARVILSSDSELEDQRVAAALRVPRSTLSEALVIARHPDLADRVLAGTLPFSTALQQSRERDRLAAEEKAAKDKLRTGAPDLLSLVDEERMSVDDAVAALDARKQKAEADAEAERARRESERRAAIANLKSVLTYLVSTSITPAELAERDYAIALDEFKQGDLDFAADTMAAIAAIKEN